MTSSRLIRGGDDASQAVAWRAPEVPSQGAPGSYRRSGDNDLTALQQRAWQQGFEQGRTAGIEAGTTELAARIEAVESILDALARPLEDLDHRVEEELLALVQAVVRQLVRRELQHDPGHLVGIIRDGLAALPLAAGDVVVRLHPSDAEAIRERLTDAADNRAWRLESDPLLERGGCLITSPRSNIDARLEARLARVIAGLLADERDEPDHQPG
ncbi:MAG: flagellar assembly protein FliH [Gammaproteobacteria bacterium]|nr:flagellar assembly protein FliH [Gammaproteobacteria bacterium]